MYTYIYIYRERDIDRERERELTERGLKGGAAKALLAARPWDEASMIHIILHSIIVHYIRLYYSTLICMYIYIYIYIMYIVYTYNIYIHMYIYIYTHIYTYIYVDVCVCVCSLPRPARPRVPNGGVTILIS